jgi:hypothetical protein
MKHISFVVDIPRFFNRLLMRRSIFLEKSFDSSNFFLGGRIPGILNLHNEPAHNYGVRLVTAGE